MKTLRFVLAVLALTGIAQAGNSASFDLPRSPSEMTTGNASDPCNGTPIWHYDGSFESGYFWYEGLESPWGAFGEAFDVGPATVECGVFWGTDPGYWTIAHADVYVWEGGISAPPGDVLQMIPDCNLGGLNMWPTCTQLLAEINCCVDGEFTVGLWPNMQMSWGEWYVCSDENGPGGFPWTNVPPGTGYPTGWQHPRVRFPRCVSMGIGATIIESPSPVQSRTWGSIKAMFE